MHTPSLPIRGACLAALFLLLPSASLHAQGTLTPPGAPAPTMKTLDQIEPRTDLQATPAPAGVDTSNVSYHFIITQPGSYYLSANLVATKTNGIRIDAAGVTLDLSGFEISRAAAAGIGIEVVMAAERATIRNGTIRNFVQGIRENGGAGCYYGYLSITGHTTSGLFQSGRGATLEFCRIVGGGGTNGIRTGDGATLENCTVTGGNYTAASSTGIFTGSGCALSRCVVASNTVQSGISAGNGNSLTECVARLNTSAAASSTGISAGGQSTITHCTASAQRSTNGALSGELGAGFIVLNGSTIQNCTASQNQGDGIRVGLAGYCMVRNNFCASNGAVGGDGAGIHVLPFQPGFPGLASCIDSNTVIDSDRGIDVDEAFNLIIRNTASFNTSNYEIVANNKVGVIVSGPFSVAISGSTGGAGVGTTDPWANLSY